MLDLETEVDTSSDLTLKKMSMVEYCHKAGLLCADVYDTKTKQHTFFTTPDSLETYLNEHMPCALCAHNGAFDFLWLAKNLSLDSFSKCSFYDTLQMCQYLCHEQAFSLGLDNVGDTMFDVGKTDDVLKLTDGASCWVDFNDDIKSKLATYTINDVKLLTRIFKVVYPQVPKVHLRLINWAIKAFIFPKLLINEEIVDELIYEKEKERKEYQLEFNAKPTQFSSAVQFSDLYLAITGEPVGDKESPSNPAKRIPALAKGDDFVLTTMHDKTDNGHESIKARLIKARLAHTANLELSRAKTWQHIMNETVGHYYYMHVAASGTFTNRPAGRNGGHGNPLNLARGSKLRYALKPKQPHNNLLIGFDFASLELRIARWVANDQPAKDAILNGGDLYAQTIGGIIQRYSTGGTHLVELTKDHCYTMGNGLWSKVNEEMVGQKVPYNQTLTDQERFIGKTTSLSCQYSVGGRQLRKALAQAGVKIDDVTAQNIVQSFRKVVHPALPKAWAYVEDFMEDRSRPRKLNLPGEPAKHGWLWPSGRHMFYYDLKQHRHAMEYGWTWCPGYAFGTKHRRRTYPGAVFQSLIQSLASEIMTDVHLRLLDAGYDVVQQIYDEITIIYPNDNCTKTAMQDIKSIAETPISWWPEGPPLEAEIKHADSYGGVH